MPGRHITDCQMRLYMSFRQADTPTIAAAKAGFSAAHRLLLLIARPLHFLIERTLTTDHKFRNASAPALRLCLQGGAVPWSD